MSSYPLPSVDDIPLAPVPTEATDMPPDYSDTDGAQAIASFTQARETARIEAIRAQHLAIPPPAKPAWTREKIQQLVTSEATRYGVDPFLAHAVADAESGYNYRARSPAGAQGVMQLMPATAKRFQVQDSWDPEQNIPGGMKYLKFLEQRFPGRRDLQLAAYNAGEGAVEKYNGIPPYAETQAYVRKTMSAMAAAQPLPAALGAPAAQPSAQAYTSRGTPPVPPDVAAEASALASRGGRGPARLQSATEPAPRLPGQAPVPMPGLRPAQIGPLPASVTNPPGGEPWVDIGIDAPGFTAGNVRSVASGFFRAVGSAYQTPATVAEILAPLVPEGVKDVAGALPMTGIPAATWVDMWHQIGKASEQLSAYAEVPAYHKTFMNTLSEAAGTMAAYWLPAFASGGSTLLATGLESASEAREVYEALKPLVGQDEAAQRAAQTLAANVVVLGLTNKLGIGGSARTILGKTGGTIIGEGVQELVQYDTQRRQMWLPVTHPAAPRLKAHGWLEDGNRVYQPFDVKTAGEILAISSILGGGLGFVHAMKFGLQDAATVQKETARVQAQDTGDVSAAMPQSVVREGYSETPTQAIATPDATPVPSTPELALPKSAVREPTGELVRVYHGTGAAFSQFDIARTGQGAGGEMWGPGLYFTEDAAVAGGRIQPVSQTIAELREEIEDTEREIAETKDASILDEDLLAGLTLRLQKIHTALAEYQQGVKREEVIGGYALKAPTPPDKSITENHIAFLRENLARLRQALAAETPPQPVGENDSPRENMFTFYADRVLEEEDVLRQTLQDFEAQVPVSEGPNVRPAYLDIRKPFDTTGRVAAADLLAIFRQAEGERGYGHAVRALGETESLSARDAYRMLQRDDLGQSYSDYDEPSKALANARLQRAGYDGIFHIGEQDGRVWIAFRPEQVIPAFEINAMLELSRQEVAAQPVPEGDPVRFPPPLPARQEGMIQEDEPTQDDTPDSPQRHRRTWAEARVDDSTQEEIAASAPQPPDVTTPPMLRLVGSNVMNAPDMPPPTRKLKAQLQERATGEWLTTVEFPEVIPGRPLVRTVREFRTYAQAVQYLADFQENYIIEPLGQATLPDLPAPRQGVDAYGRTFPAPSEITGAPSVPYRIPGVNERNVTQLSFFRTPGSGEFGGMLIAPGRRRLVLSRWQRYLEGGERGAVPLPEGQEPTGQPDLAQQVRDLDDRIALAEAFGESPDALRVQRDALLQQQVADEAAAQAPQPEQGPPEAPIATPPSLMAEARAAEPSALSGNLAAEAAARLANNRLRDARGRWRIPLKRIPSTELELQDFVRQKGGIRLEGETDMPGELRDVITRKETQLYGLHNDRSGQTLEHMAEMAADNGFIATADKALLLEAMDRSVRQGALVYSQQATGHVPGIRDADLDTEPAAPRPLRPAPPFLEGQPQRSVFVLSDAQIRMHERAMALSSFIVGDRVEFRLPNGQQRQGHVVSTVDTEVTVQYGRKGDQFTIDVLSPDMRSIRLELTKAQQKAEAAGIVDLPQVLSSQIEAILQQPDGEITGRVTGINYDRLTSEMSVKRLWADMMAGSQEYIAEARREGLTHADLLAMAQDNIAKKRFTIDTLLQRAPGQTLSPEDVVAARLMGISMAEELANRVKAFQDSPTLETQNALQQFFPLALKIAAQWSGLAAETGRALSAFKIGVGGEMSYVEEVGNRLTSVPLGVTMEEFAEHLSGLKTREEMLAALVKVPTWGELFLAGLYGVKLSRLTTDAKNIMGSAGAFLWSTGVRQVAGVLPGSGDVSAGEATAMLYGWWHANTMMLRLWRDLSNKSFLQQLNPLDQEFWQRFNTFGQEITERIGFDDLANRLKTEGLSGSQTIASANILARGAMSGPVGRLAGQAIAGGPIRAAMVDFVGALLHFSGAKLNFEDLTAKVYNYIGEGYAQGYRDAMSQDPPLEGEAFWNHVTDYAMNMKGTVKEKAKQFAFENTLTEKLGPLASHAEAMLNAAPLLRLAILFFRTPLNAARWSIRNGPLGILSAKNWEDMRAGGAEADIARAKMAMGSTFMLLGGMAGLMGLATGRHPGNRDARKLLIEDAKIPEYAVWVPGLGRYMNYDWGEPVSSILGFGADLGAIVRSGRFRDLDTVEAVFAAGGAVVTAGGNNVLSRTWMSGANDLFRTFMPPASMSEEAKGQEVWRYAKRQFFGMNPPLVRDVRRIADPAIRETYTFLDQLMNELPFLSKNLPISHNILGYGRQNKDALGPDYVSPFIAPAYTPKRIFAEMERLISQGYLSMPDRPRRLLVDKEPIDLTAEEISQLELRIAGGDPDKTGEPGRLETSLLNLMRSDRYRDGLSDYGRAAEITKRLHEHMSDGRKAFIHERSRLREESQRIEREHQQRQYQRPAVGR